MQGHWAQTERQTSMNYKLHPLSSGAEESGKGSVQARLVPGSGTWAALSQGVDSQHHPTLQTRGPFLCSHRAFFLHPLQAHGSSGHGLTSQTEQQDSGSSRRRGFLTSRTRARQLDCIRFPGGGELTPSPESPPRWMLPGWWTQWNELCMSTPCKFPSEKPGKVQSGDDHGDAPTSANMMDGLEPLSLVKTHSHRAVRTPQPQHRELSHPGTGTAILDFSG